MRCGDVVCRNIIPIVSDKNNMFGVWVLQTRVISVPTIDPLLFATSDFIISFLLKIENDHEFGSSNKYRPVTNY